jgi:hypothetical protein
MWCRNLITEAEEAKMKKKFAAGLAAVLLMLGTAGISSASTLTFDDPANLGVTLGGNMQWNGTGGGHLFMNYWDDTDYIFTVAPHTYVNDFQMNYQPWQGYGLNPSDRSGWLVDIKAYDAANNLLWSQSVDLASTASDWNNWMTVTVKQADVATLAFGPTGGGALTGLTPAGYWPSIDNLRTNEANAPVPEPSTFLLLGAGLAGFGFLKKRKRS